MDNNRKSNDFILRGKELFGDRYDYSLTNYTGSNSLVKIICRDHGTFEQVASNHLRGRSGCSDCNISKKNNEFYSRFLDRAKEVHGDRYDYSLTTPGVNKAEIICRTHGSFIQKKSKHITGQGCPICGREATANAAIKPISSHDFFRLASLAHIDANFVYEPIEETVFCITKINFKCAKHPNYIIKQEVRHHLSGRGCRRCVTEQQASIKILRFSESFVLQSREVHGDHYDYSLSKYNGIDKPISIICADHGEFKQRPSLHKNGAGCPKCAYEHSSVFYTKNTEQFIEDSIKIHGDMYDYSEALYTGSHDYVNIICKKHGKFKQTATSHLGGHGCSRCTNQISKKEKAWLDSLNVPNRQESIQLFKNKRKSKVDGFDPVTNTIYFFHGDFWHGNPKVYSHDYVNVVTKKTMGEHYASTLAIEEAARLAGYNLIVKWETE